MTAKDLLIKQTQSAFSENSLLSLKGSLKDLSQEEASCKLSDGTRTIEEIVSHVSSFKIGTCIQEFGNTQLTPDDTSGDIGKAVELLEKANENLVTCLQETPEQDLERAIKMELPFESLGELIWILIMHDISHAAQIRTIRRACSE